MVRKGYSVIKRISLLVTAALLVATMAMAGLAGPAFADPDCSKVGDNNKNCRTVTENPGGVENSPSCQPNRNPNCETKDFFKDRPN